MRLATRCEVTAAVLTFPSYVGLLSRSRKQILRRIEALESRLQPHPLLTVYTLVKKRALRKIQLDVLCQKWVSIQRQVGVVVRINRVES